MASLSWDFTNRLLEYEKAAGEVSTYRYDPFGRRIEKSVEPDGAGGSPAVTTWYVWDGDMLLGEYAAGSRSGASTRGRKAMSASRSSIICWNHEQGECE